MPALAPRERGRKLAGEKAASIGGAQEWSVSTFLLNSALLEEYIQQASVVKREWWCS